MFWGILLQKTTPGGVVRILEIAVGAVFDQGSNPLDFHELDQGNFIESGCLETLSVYPRELDMAVIKFERQLALVKIL